MPTSGPAWSVCLWGAAEVSKWSPAHSTPPQTEWSHSTALGPLAWGLHTHTYTHTQLSCHVKHSFVWPKSLGVKTFRTYISRDKSISHSLALQIHVAVGGSPWKTDSCHFPKMECTTFPFESVTTPSISFTVELHEFALKKTNNKQISCLYELDGRNITQNETRLLKYPI